MRLPSIDVARIVATIAIYLFHAWSALPDGVESEGATLFLSHGYLGVLVFDMVAGLVATLPHWGPASRPLPPFGGFLRHRFRRLAPQYWIVLLCCAAVGGGTLSAVLAHLAFVHTLSPHWFFAIVPAFWWLGLMAQFTVAFPLLLRLFRFLGPSPAVLILCGGSWILWSTMDRLAAAAPGSALALVNYMGYYNLPYRLPEFVAGMAIAVWIAPVLADGTRPLDLISLRADRRADPGPMIRALIIGPFVAGGLCLWADRGVALPAWHAVLVALFGIFVVPRVIFSPGAARLGEIPFVQRAGALSYGFYLVHQPVLSAGAELLRPWLGSPWAFRLLVPVGVLLSAGLAVVLEWLEKWMLAALAGGRAGGGVERGPS